MKLLVGLLCAILFAVVGTTTDAHAYFITNNTPVPVNGVVIQTTCGPFGPYSLAAGPISINIPIPVGCTVTGIRFRGAFFAIGYNGPVPLPNPPNGVTVTPNGATFW